MKSISLGIIIILAAAIAIGGVLELSGAKANRYPKQAKEFVVGKFESYFHKHEEESHQEHSKIVVTSPKVQDVIITQPYVCQIHSQRHIEVRALEGGYLERDPGQGGPGGEEGRCDVQDPARSLQGKAGRRDGRGQARATGVQQHQEVGREKTVVSEKEVELLEAKLAKAQAKAELAEAELNFTDVKAPFDGIVDRLHEQQGSLVKEGDILTTLSDNSVMWVYFNVPEKRYLEYMANRKQHEKEDRIELMLANGDKFPQTGKIGAIEAKFNNETGNITFRADFPNPDGLLRHGQTGTILIHRPLKNAIVIPQRATFELLDKRYVWVVGEDDVVHQTPDHHQARTGGHFRHRVADSR